MRKLILLRKRFFRSQSFNIALSIIDLKSYQKTAIESRFSYGTQYIYGYYYFSQEEARKSRQSIL